MRFEIPQFINIEDKIFGPFTLKQFLYLIGGAGGGYIAYRFLPLFLAIPIIGLIVGFALALAFYKLNNQPFIEIVEGFLTYSFKSKMYLWKKEKNENPQKSSAPTVVPTENTSGEPKNFDQLARNLDLLDQDK
jgi:hypothetical protein